MLSTYRTAVYFRKYHWWIQNRIINLNYGILDSNHETVKALWVSLGNHGSTGFFCLWYRCISIWEFNVLKRKYFPIIVNIYFFYLTMNYTSNNIRSVVFDTKPLFIDVFVKFLVLRLYGLIAIGAWISNSMRLYKMKLYIHV